MRMIDKTNPNYKNAGHRICEGCGGPYFSYDKNRKFCTRSCYNASPQKRENSKRANDGRRRSPHPCKNCRSLIHYSRVYCDDCNPYNKPIRKGVCLHCSQAVGSKYDVQFCKACRATGIHKKEVFSICAICGDKVKGKYNRKYCDKHWKEVMRIGRGKTRRKDANHNEIESALQQAGCSTLDCSAVGCGFPDLVVGRLGKTYLLEIKNPATRGKLNKLQQAFFDMWRGQAAVVYNIEEAFEIVGIL